MNNCVVKWKNKNEMLLSEEIHALLPKQTHVSKKKIQKMSESLGKSYILNALLIARQSCIMPYLIRKNTDLFHLMGWSNINLREALSYSSKLDAVIDFILLRKDNGNGKIIFCHFKTEIDTITERLLSGGMKKVVSYDGRNSGGHNLAILHEPADALIIQIQTGCEGLNLQENFSEIYFISPHWNPSVEDQAVARCHRIGQTKPVNIFKFEMKGFKKKGLLLDPITLEKYINTIQDKKREISKQMFEEIE
jgi:SNF2 family DNA or RNA helicase